MYFGAVKANVVSSTSTTLSVTTPTGVTYAPMTVTDTTTHLTAYSAQPFAVTFASSHVINAASFAAKVDSTTGNLPIAAAISDIDGDGKPDIVVSNSSSNTISVLRNASTAGTVSLVSKSDFATGNSPKGEAIDDLDGDGKPDVVVANWNSNTVSVLRNTSTTGNLGFAAKVDLPTGSYPSNVAISDVDGDGKPDIVVSNYSSNTVSVYRNTSTVGNLSFAAKVDYATGSSPEGVVLWDVDGDGKPDIIVANSGSATVSVLLNTSTVGSISYAAKSDFATGSGPSLIAVSDLDGDGKVDILVANWSGNTVSALRNTSTTGTISFATRIDYATGSGPNFVAVCDVDGDGKPDVAVSNYSGNTVSILRNTSHSWQLIASCESGFFHG